MSAGSRQICHLTKETTVGVTPSPFNRTAMPFTEFTLDAVVNKENSNTILDSRIPQKGQVTGVDCSGDLNAEFRFGTYDDLMAAAAFNAWETDVPVADQDKLTFGGKLRQTFSAIRGYTDVGANGNYHIFKGVHVNTMNITIPESGLITVGFGLMAKGRTPASVMPAGSVTVPTLTPIFSNVSVADFLVNGVSQVGVSCVTAFTFNWNNTMQVQKCLGAKLEVGAIIETEAEGTGSFTMAWSPNAAANYEKQFTNTLIGLEVPLQDAETGGNEYVLVIPKIEITSPLPSGSNTDIIQADFDYRVVEEAPYIIRKPTV